MGVALVPLVMALKSGPNYVGVSERGLALRRERGLAFAVASSGSGVTEVSHRLLFCSRAILVAFGLARYFLVSLVFSMHGSSDTPRRVRSRPFRWSFDFPRCLLGALAILFLTVRRRLVTRVSSRALCFIII